MEPDALVPGSSTPSAASTPTHASTPTPDAPATGDDVVDAALAELARLDTLELDRHPAVVDAVQEALADRLAEND